MLMRVLALLMGIIYIVIGVLGFIPSLIWDHELFSVFEGNPMLNLLHIVSGAIFILTGISSSIISKVYFILFGLFYVAIALAGFAIGEGIVFNVFVVNYGYNIFHIVTGGVSAFIGMFIKAD